MEVVARIESPFRTKFGVPRQAGLVDCEARVVFEEKYRVAEAVRGIEEYDYLWLIWGFHLAEREGWSPTVRPPRLGGNKRVGVFATRSPYRPNAIGLSSVRLIRVEQTKDRGAVLWVSGADLVDGTPIYDIKPYLPYADSHPDARGGFAQERPAGVLTVIDPEGRLAVLGADADVVRSIIAQDPRPHYQHDKERVYTMEYGGREIRFKVDEWVAVVIAVEAT